MKHKWLIVAFAVQFALIVLVLLNGFLPVLFGDEVKLRAKGYDPRDVLAGNFVRLYYDIRLKEDELTPIQYREIKEFFVMLVDENADGVFEFGAKSFYEPKDGLYVKAKRSYTWSGEFQIGAEKYFTTKEKAFEIERKLATLNLDEDNKFGALVTLKIYKGKARIVDLEVIENVENHNSR